MLCERLKHAGIGNNAVMQLERDNVRLEQINISIDEKLGREILGKVFDVKLV